MRAAPVIFLSLFVGGALSGRAAADIVELKNGGKIHGEIANAGDKTATSYVITTDGGGRMTIPRSEVVRILRSIAAAGGVSPPGHGRWPTRSTPTGNWRNGAATRSSSTSIARSWRRFWSSTRTTNRRDWPWAIRNKTAAGSRATK